MNQGNPTTQPWENIKDVLKTPKLVIFYHLFDIFSETSDLIPFA